MEICEGVGS